MRTDLREHYNDAKVMCIDIAKATIVYWDIITVNNPDAF